MLSIFLSGLSIMHKDMYTHILILASGNPSNSLTASCFNVSSQASGTDGTPSVLTSSISLGDATSSIKVETGQESVAEQGVYHPPTSCYDHYYPG